MGALTAIRSWSVTFRETSTDERERLAARLAESPPASEERVLVHTCHRAEVFAAAASDDAFGRPPAGMTERRGREAVERLFVVAAGLDSAVVAEEQVLGQLRDAYGGALARGETGAVLNELFRRAIRFGKHVRATTTPAGRDRSLVDRAVAWLAERTDPSGRSVLLVGTGQVARELAHRLDERGAQLSVTSRSVERAAELVSRLPGADRHAAVAAADGLALVAEAEVVALATGPKARVLEDAERALANRLAADAAAPWVIDLMAPAATSALRERLGDRLCDLETLGATPDQGLVPRDRSRVEREVGDAVDDAMRWIETRATGDAVRLLREHAGAVRRRHLAGLNGSLDEHQMERVEAASAAMVAELLHVPSLQLRRDPEAAARIRSLFGIEQ